MSALMYCPTCNENSIARITRHRKRDGAKTYTEYCRNKNPKCMYRHHRVIEKGPSENPEKTNSTAGPGQLELFK